MKVAVTLSPRDYDLVLFDLDGVLTRTASVHAAAWKKLFDGFLEQPATKAGTPFVPFDIETDYTRYVAGKPRYDGVADFLESRRIELPLGAPEDGPDVQSVRNARQSQGPILPRAAGAAASSPMNRRSRWCAHCGHMRSRPPLCPPATTARWCSRRRASQSCSTREWTGWISPASSSKASRPRMLSWRRHGASTRCLRVPSSWKTRSPALRPGAPADSAPSSASIADGTRRRTGWTSQYHFGINLGPVVLMCENYRSGLRWRLMRACPYVATGLRRAGFTNGWL